MNPSHSSKRGFTLLEVMIALAFFALIGMVLQQVTAATLGQYQSIRLKTFASYMAENKMAELRLSKSLPTAKEYKEELTFANHEWELITKVKTTENPDINRVEVEVFFIDAETDKKSKRHTLTGFLGRY